MMLPDVPLTSVWRRLTSVAYIGPKSKTARSGKNRIGIEVGHVMRDSDTTHKVKRSKVKVTGRSILLWRPPAQLVDIVNKK